MHEDVNTVSPTLGFIIKTIDYGGYEALVMDSVKGAYDEAATSSTSGTLVARRRFDHIGETTLKRRMH